MLSVESNWTVFKRLLQFQPLEAIVDKKAQPSSPAPKARTQTDGRKPSKGFGLRGESLERKAGKRAHFSSG